MILFNQVSFSIPQAKRAQLPKSLVFTMGKMQNNFRRHIFILTFNNIEKYDLPNSTGIGSIDITPVQKLQRYGKHWLEETWSMKEFAVYGRLGLGAVGVESIAEVLKERKAGPWQERMCPKTQPHACIPPFNGLCFPIAKVLAESFCNSVRLYLSQIFLTDYISFL